MSLFPVKVVTKEVVQPVLKDLTDKQINDALDLLQVGASHSDVKYAVGIPTSLVYQIEHEAKRVVSKVLPILDKAKSVNDLKKVEVEAERKDLIVDKMVALSLPDGKGTITTLKEAVGIVAPIEPKPIDGQKIGICGHILFDRLRISRKRGERYQKRQCGNENYSSS